MNDPSADSNGDSNVPQPEFPQPVVQSNPAGLLLRFGSRLWLVTLICLVLAIGLTWRATSNSGKRITIYFQQGHGIKSGDALRHLGIEVGRVEAVELARGLDGIHITVRLHANATELASEGSRFWIVRPQLSLTRMRGLETIIGAKYIAVLPGSSGAPAKDEFQGVETPLLLSETGFEEIEIRFGQGFGLVVGDPVQYRGIVVGEVTGVRLRANLDGVSVTVRLIDSASSIARAGTQFWVERPRVSIREVRGLETLVAGRHIATLPGPEDAPRQTEFQGLDVAPTGEMPEGGLEIVLYGPQLRGLQPAAPVLYRGVPVGHIVAVGLATDATMVEARAFVQPAFRQLVRRNSVFWNESGIDFSVGITGVEFNANTLSNVATGGVAFATPDPPGSIVNTGARFQLLDQPDDERLAWQPHLAVGSHALPEGTSLPQLTRASLQWREKTFGISRSRQATGWVLPLSDQQVLGERQLLMPSAKAEGGTAQLAIGGEEFPVTSAMIDASVPVSIIRLNMPLPKTLSTWPSEQLRRPTDPEPCLLVRDGATTPFPLTINSLKHNGDAWLIDDSVPLSEDWAGAVAIATQDGKVLGITQIQKGQARIAFVSD